MLSFDVHTLVMKVTKFLKSILKLSIIYNLTNPSAVILDSAY